MTAQAITVFPAPGGATSTPRSCPASSTTASRWTAVRAAVQVNSWLVPGKRWSRYRPSKTTFREGQRLLRQAEREQALDAARELFEIKQDVASAGFSELLERVYAEYPEFAVNSIFRRSV